MSRGLEEEKEEKLVLQRVKCRGSADPEESVL